MLRCEDVDVAYGDRRLVLHQVGLEVRAGEIVGVFGPNGAGKSTLIRTLMGLLPGQPRSGAIHLFGALANGWSTPVRVRSGLACVPEGREVFAALTVRENLTMGALSKPRSSMSAERARVHHHFPRLRERAGQLAGTLSGGEQQMLAIGRALMSRPRLLLLDEPSLGLAPKIVQEIFTILEALRDEGVTILLVEQNAGLGLSVADRAYVLAGGRIEASGARDALLASPEIRRSYLGLADSSDP